MYLLPLVFSNLHMGMNAPFDMVNPVLDRTSVVQSGFPSSQFFFLPYPLISPEQQFLDLFKPSYPKLQISTSVQNDVLTLTVPLQQYKPDEVSWKREGRWLIIEGKHESKTDGGMSQQQFMTGYLLPDHADVDQINSTMSSDALKITVPLKPEEKKIEIEQPADSSNNEKEAGASGTVVEDNEVKEEVTATQAQEAGPKPEKR